MALTLTLPTPSRTLEAYTLRGTAPAWPPAGVSFNRIAYSAAQRSLIGHRRPVAHRRDRLGRHHRLPPPPVVAGPGCGRGHGHGLAQRGMGLDWASSLSADPRLLDAAKDVPGALVASGCGTDHLDLDAVKTVEDVIRGYEEQMEAIEALGGKLIVMASRALARVARNPTDYQRVYDRVPSQARQPVVLHWLGDMFDPALERLRWGTTDLNAAMDTALGIIAAHADKVDGIKISLLDKDKEIAMRRRLPPGVRMYTGDDFNYAELIAGDGFGAEPTHGKSDALLGIFDAIAPAASAALGELAAGNLERFHAILGPTVPLSRHIFQAPTRFYKTGVVFMAWLNGHQSHFTMVGGQQSTRSLQHLAELFRLADAANRSPELAVARMKHLLAVHGVERLNVATLPDRIADVEALEALMSTPSPALIETLARVEGDLMVLGVGGKMGQPWRAWPSRPAPGGA